MHCPGRSRPLAGHKAGLLCHAGKKRLAGNTGHSNLDLLPGPLLGSLSLCSGDRRGQRPAAWVPRGAMTRWAGHRAGAREVVGREGCSPASGLGGCDSCPCSWWLSLCIPPCLFCLKHLRVFIVFFHLKEVGGFHLDQHIGDCNYMK